MGMDKVAHKVRREGKGTRKIPTLKERAGKERPASDVEKEQ